MECRLGHTVTTAMRTLFRESLKNVSLSNTGVLKLAPALEELVEISAPIVWTAIADKDGNLYLGTGNLGKILKVDTEGEISTMFSPEEVLSRALAIDAEGNLFVGTSPMGRVYRITPGGRPEIYLTHLKATSGTCSLIRKGVFMSPRAVKQ